jgi:hypothetical protein
LGLRAGSNLHIYFTGEDAMAKINSTEKSDEVKRCSKCGETKARTEFHKARAKHDGLADCCKACNISRVAKWYKDNMERRRAYMRSRHRENVEAARLHEKRYPLKRKARKTLKNAVVWGKIARPLECSKCLATTGIMHGHHHDYSKPLDVTWLCRACHISVHMAIKRKDAT